MEAIVVSVGFGFVESDGRIAAAINWLSSYLYAKSKHTSRLDASMSVGASGSCCSNGSPPPQLRWYSRRLCVPDYIRSLSC